MRIAIMQPYFFPYIGYYQLISAVDVFVIYDDCTFRKSSWINRNRIDYFGAAKRITQPLHKASQNKLIKETIACPTDGGVLNSILLSYQNFQNFSTIFPLLCQCILHEDRNLAHLLHLQLRTMCDHIGIKNNFIFASDLKMKGSIKGQERLIEICKFLGASEYVNLPGGRSLYSAEGFKESGIKLLFINSKARLDRVRGGISHGPLSVIDTVMRLNAEAVRGVVSTYSLSSN